MTMETSLPWLRVLIAIVVYVAVAMVTSLLVRRSGADLTDVRSRTSTRVALLGLGANLVILAAVTLMVVVVDGRTIGTLGLSVSTTDAEAMATGTALIATSAGAFLMWMRRSGRVELRRHKPDRSAAGGVALMVAVLLVVALQEEALYRGYVVLNLLRFGWVVAAGASIVTFTAIHLLTNRSSPWQISSWVMGGAVLVCAYLVSGSLWVAVALHLVIDVTNVVAFGIVDRYSLVSIEPALTDRSRAWYRAGVSFLLVVMLLLYYGAHVRIA